MVAKAAKRDRKAYQAAYYQRNKGRLSARRTAARRKIQAEANGVKPKAAERLTGAKAAKAIAGWSAKNLVVPTPPRQGEKFRLADWQVSFLKNAFGPGVKEAALSIARRNGKSFLIAVVLLAHLCGPMAGRIGGRPTPRLRLAKRRPLLAGAKLLPAVAPPFPTITG